MNEIQYNYYPITIEVKTGEPSAENPQANTPAVVLENTNILNSANGSVVGTGTVQSPNFAPGAAGWRLDSNGNIEANDGNFRGDITGATGTFSGTVSGGSLDIGGDDATSFHVDSGGGIWSGASIANKATAPFKVSNAGVLDATGVNVSGAITAGVGSSVAAAYLSGVIAQANLNVSNRGWVQTSAFSVTDADTVAWGSGTFTSADGTAYSISAGNTGNMSAKTYIYLDTAVSTTAYQVTTTVTTALGVGKVLVAVAQNGAVEATYKVLQGQGGENIDAANIVAGSITGNEIAASTITSGKISVSQLSAIAADLGAITAGTITVDSAGYIRGGQTAYNTGTGFFLGYSGTAYKFSIGVPTGDYLLWDGSILTMSASKIIKLFPAGISLTPGQVVYIATDGKVYSGDAYNVAGSRKVLGICLSTTAKDESAQIQTFGTIVNLSSLTIGSIYYLGNATHTVDQECTTHNNYISIGESETHWQSFTTGGSITHISRITAYLDGAIAENITLRLRTGEGTGGSLLGTVVSSYPGSIGTVIFQFDNPIPVSASTQYTMTFQSSGTATNLCQKTTSAISGGRNDQSALYDYRVATYYSTNRGAVGTSAGTTSKIIGVATSATELHLSNVIT